ncbi:MAG: enoyl-CoA hydratase-related protein [Elusimicrobiota bacterium]
MSIAEAREKEEVLVSTDGPVGIVTINRRHTLNALSYTVVDKIVRALEAFDRDESIRCMVLTGGAKVFAAGADIKELEPDTGVGMSRHRSMERMEGLRRIAKPVIAAVSGYALGGGCELAMACDVIVASETAAFGQPEVNLGVIPGYGGTQRLTRAVGKACAMDMLLTGRRLNAQEALARGLVSRVVPVENFMDEAVALAREIAKKGPLAIRMCKDAVSKAEDLSLEQGLAYERQLFYLIFSSEDQKEGMRAFREKREPSFKGS